MGERTASCRPVSFPVFLRIAGLSAAIMEGFSTRLATEELTDLREAERELRSSQEEMVHRLQVLASAPAPLRRVLLAIKRDCFNGRPVAGRRGAPGWRELAEIAGPELARLLVAEERAGRAAERLAAGHRQEWDRETEALRALSEDRGFRRGLALASPGLTAAAGRPTAPARKARKLELSLLRYASRAALKLSPYATFTRVAFGLATEDRGPSGVRLPRPLHQWRERSLLRVRRYLIEQDLAMLLRYPAFRDRLEVRLNDTLETISPGRFRLVRPGRWGLSADGARLRHEPAAVSEIAGTGPLIPLLLERLGLRPAVYGELAAELEREIGSGEASEVLATVLDDLVRAGFLVLRLPWSSNEPHLEARLLEDLRSLPADSGLVAVIPPLEDLVRLEETFGGGEPTERPMAEVDRSLAELWQATAPLAGLAPEVARSRAKAAEAWEDVLLESPEAGIVPEVLRVPRAVCGEILRSAGPWARLAGLQGYAFDFLLSLAGQAARQWPGCDEVGAVELFAAVQPLWREYRELLASAKSGGWTASFNPLGLERVEELRRLREGLWRDTGALLAAAPAGAALDPEAFEPLLARIPPWCEPVVGPCLFLQPADSTGKLWVLNRMFEGTGRYGSRYTALMDEPLRRFYTEGLARRSRVETADGPAELVDLLWSQGDTLNVHAVQTARVLAVPGETLGREVLAVGLGELRVRLGEGRGLPWLSDGAGRKLLPVHLGGAAAAYLPPLLQFLALWGPGEARSPRPPAPVRRCGEVRIEERVTVGNVVLLRKRWTLPSGLLRETLRDLGGAESFVALNRWRTEQGLPDRLFWIERIRHPEAAGDVRKPQYLDFTSPHFAEVFRSGLELQGDNLTFEEALPAPADLPRDPEGNPWAVEVHLETLALEEEAAAASWHDRSTRAATALF